MEDEYISSLRANCFRERSYSKLIPYSEFFIARWILYYRPHSGGLGEVIFSQISVCPGAAGLWSLPWWEVSLSPPWSGHWSYPKSCSMSCQRERVPQPGRGYPWPGQRLRSTPSPGHKSKWLLRSLRFPTGGLSCSCFIFSHFHFKNKYVFTWISPPFTTFKEKLFVLFPLQKRICCGEQGITMIISYTSEHRTWRRLLVIV